MANKFGFDRVIQNIERVKRELPVLLANQAKNYFLRSFKTESFDGKPWKPVKRKGKKGSQRNNSAILVQSGRLRRGVANSIYKVGWDAIVLKIDPAEVPYAAVHNQGLRAGRGAGFQMEKREFVGDTAELRAQQRATINKYIDKVWHD